MCDDDEGVNVEHNDGDKLFLPAHIDTWVGVSGINATGTYMAIDGLIPDQWRLLEPIEAFSQAPHLGWVLRVNKPLRLVYVDLIVEVHL